MKRLLLTLVLFCALTALAAIPTSQTEWLPPTMKATPPMGWNPWFLAGAGNTETNTFAAMNYALTNGFVQLGYVYFNLDDGWGESNRVNGHLIMDRIKWPNGITNFVNFAHTNGLKVGLYTETGPNPQTVGGFQPSSYGFENVDAADFGAWGIDYIKIDGDGGTLSFQDCQIFLKTNNQPALLESGRFGFTPAMHRSYNIARPAGLFGDVVNYSALFQWVDEYMKRPYIYGPGHWAYLDIINTSFNLGGGVTLTQDGINALKSQVSMSAMLSSPLILSTFTDRGAQYITNSEIISLDQDPGVFCATKIYSNSLAEIYSKKLVNYPNSKAVALVNRGLNPVTITAAWTPGAPYGGVATVRDLWARSPVAYATNTWSTNVASHDCVVLRIDPGKVPPFPYGTNFLSDFAFMPVWTNSFFTNAGGGNFDVPIQYNKSISGNTLNIGPSGGTNFLKGMGFHCDFEAKWFLGQQATNFSFTAGVDNEVSGGGYILQVYGDGTLLATTASLTTTNTWTTNVNVAGVTILDLKGTSTQAAGSESNNHADIVNPVLFCPYPTFGH